MNKIANIKTLTHQEEIEFLRQAKEGRTNYDILGIIHNASEEEINEVYKKKLEDILKIYLDQEEDKKKKAEFEQITKAYKTSDDDAYKKKLEDILKIYLDQEEDKKKKAEFEQITKAYKTLANKKTKTTYDRKNKDLFSKREKATRLLIYYNRSFVKYLVGGYYYNEINSEDLVTEGTVGLLQAIREFDLSRAEKYRLASFASYWIHQRIRTFIKKSHLFPQATQKKPDFVDEEETDLSEDEKKLPQKRSWGIIYYDKDYSGTEKDNKAVSWLDTLTDDSEQQAEQQSQHEENKIKINELISQLEYHEELIIRLFFGIAPVNLNQINRLVTEEKAKELKKSKSRKNAPSLEEKYHEILAIPRKKEEIVQEFMRPEFWEHFRQFPESTLKTESLRKTSAKKLAETKQAIDPTEQKKWKGLSEQQILRWINLGYQPEDALDPQNQILQKLGVSKKEKEQWKKTGGKTKSENWLELRLGKALDNRKKILLEKLKQISAKKQ